MTASTDSPQQDEGTADSTGGHAGERRKYVRFAALAALASPGHSAIHGTPGYGMGQLSRVRSMPKRSRCSAPRPASMGWANTSRFTEAVCQGRPHVLARARREEQCPLPCSRWLSEWRW